MASRNGDPGLTDIRPVEKDVSSAHLAEILSGSQDVAKKACATGLDAFIVHSVCSQAEAQALRDKSEVCCVASVDTHCTKELRYSFWNSAAPDKKDFRNADTVWP